MEEFSHAKVSHLSLTYLETISESAIREIGRGIQLRNSALKGEREQRRRISPSHFGNSSRPHLVSADNAVSESSFTNPTRTLPNPTCRTPFFPPCIPGRFESKRHDSAANSALSQPGHGWGVHDLACNKSRIYHAARGARGREGGRGGGEAEDLKGRKWGEESETLGR